MYDRLTEVRVIIIPARGGSKGVPLKNLRQIGGKSLIQRAVTSALGARADLVIVSTDNQEISTQGNALGALIHNRSEDTSGDTASSESVIKEVIQDLGDNWPSDASVALLQATSPFIETSTINDCLDLAGQGKVGFSAVQSHKFLWMQTTNGWQPINHPIDHRPRRQELEGQVYETGAVYAFPKDEFLKFGYRFCAPAVPVLVSQKTAIDIDSIDDLLLAETLAGQMDSLQQESM